MSLFIGYFCQADFSFFSSNEIYQSFLLWLPGFFCQSYLERLFSLWDYKNIFLWFFWICLWFHFLHWKFWSIWNLFWCNVWGKSPTFLFFFKMATSCAHWFKMPSLSQHSLIPFSYLGQSLGFSFWSIDFYLSIHVLIMNVYIAWWWRARTLEPEHLSINSTSATYWLCVWAT